MKRVHSVLLATFMLLFCSSAFATNGMLMEGYGPISHAMGGTSMAFDNGTGAMANNPATLGLMPLGNRIDVSFGFMHPDVTFKTPAQDFDSDSNFFMMPAAGYVRRHGDWALGIGMFSQGGMGTDYLNPLNMYSQVIFGKVIVPAAYNLTDKFTIGATLEYVRAEMDLVMPLGGGYMLDFRDGSDMSGATAGEGISGKLGLVYQFHERLRFGASYQLEGGLDDLTGRGARVEGLDLPAVASAGFAVQVTDKLMLTADYNRIFWSNSMETITVTQNDMKVPFVQDWDDQNVFAFGLAYDILPELTLRLGASFANNPIKENCTPLFPAILEDHYTAGFGYRFNEMHSVDASLGYAPRVEQANGLGFAGTSTSHSQTNYQVMYSLRF